MWNIAIVGLIFQVGVLVALQSVRVIQINH